MCKKEACTSKDHAGARGRSYRLDKYWSTELSPVSRSESPSKVEGGSGTRKSGSAKADDSL